MAAKSKNILRRANALAWISITGPQVFLLAHSVFVYTSCTCASFSSSRSSGGKITALTFQRCAVDLSKQQPLRKSQERKFWMWMYHWQPKSSNLKSSINTTQCKCKFVFLFYYLCQLSHTHTHTLVQSLNGATCIQMTKKPTLTNCTCLRSIATSGGGK